MKKNFLLLLFSVCLALPTWAYNFTDSTFSNDVELAYKIISASDLTAEVTGENYTYTFDSSVTFHIPGMVNVSAGFYYIQGIGEGAFENAVCGNDVSVVISSMESNVTYINARAFRNFTGLTSLTFGTNVASIGEAAFQGCTGLTAIELPSNVTTIEASTFDGCSSLGSITLSSNVTSIGASAFSGCVGFTEFVVPETVTSIGSKAFSSCTGLTSVTSGRTTPADCAEDAFEGLNYDAVTLHVPSGTADLYRNATGWSVFTNIQEEGVILQDGQEMTIDGINYRVVSPEDRTVELADNTSYTGALTIPESFEYSGATITVVGIGENAFYDGVNYNTKLTSVVMPNTVTYIGADAFRRCTTLTSVTFSENLKTIGENAFYNCYNWAQDIVVPDGVTTIPNGAFRACEKLTSITLGSRVTWIGDYAFNTCGVLTEFVIPERVTWLGTQSFGNCTGLTTITSLNTDPPTCDDYVFANVDVTNIILYVPESSVETYTYATTWADFFILAIGEEVPSGIDALPSNSAQIVDYYTIGGQKVNSPVKGVNIVRFSDGSVKKICVK